MARVMVIGLDGAEPSLVRRWIDGGRLPNLAALEARGALLPCASTSPPVTFPAWTTCVTGVNPGRHGIFDFTEWDGAAQRLRFVNSSYRTAPALWHVLSEQGKRCCVIGIPGTYPPEPVNGIMVAGFDSPVATRTDRSFVSPADEWPVAALWHFADFQESRIDRGWHERALRKLHASIRTKEQVLVGLLKREPWDFFMAVLGEMDTVSHHFWLFHDPKSPRHKAGFEDAIQSVYERLDETVGKMVEAAGPDVAVLIVSDHGFGGAGTGVVHLNNWLASRGYLAYRGAPGSGSLLKKAAMRIVPDGLKGRLFRAAPGLAARAEGGARTAGIAWDQTRAWSEELNYFPSIRVNVQGRDAHGVVPAEEYDGFVAELCRELEAWEWVERAWPRAALYDGPSVELAPDIIVELKEENGYSVNCLRARGGAPFRRMAEHEYIGGKERGMNGTHRPMGVLMVPQPVAVESASLLDVAPTVLGLMGAAGPAMEGRNLCGAAPAAGDFDRGGNRSETSAEDAQVLEERLRALGYYE